MISSAVYTYKGYLAAAIALLGASLALSAAVGPPGIGLMGAGIVFLILAVQERSKTESAETNDDQPGEKP